MDGAPFAQMGWFLLVLLLRQEGLGASADVLRGRSEQSRRL